MPITSPLGFAARRAYRADLTMQYLWASQQAIEKYLKCILPLNRIPAADVKHDLELGLAKIAAGGIMLDLTESTKKFIDYIDTYGRFRYLETSPYVFGHDIIKLDRTVWELRRFCTLSEHGRHEKLTDGVVAPKIRLSGGYLEKIIDKEKHPARTPLLWQNGFFGKRVRRTVRIKGGFHAKNSPLFLNPHILDEVVKYVYLPKEVKAACRKLRDEGDRRLS
ncbi:MAG TPA: hypothetical protein VFM35_01390 [Candidatus Binatia bacterium]|nr:hypothetical protein [Candidatus Binatia bacterium]